MKRPFFLFAAALCSLWLAAPLHALSDDSDSDSDSEQHHSDRQNSDHRDHGQVAVFGSTAVAPGSTVEGDNVTVFGSSTVDGTVTHDVVTVFGGCRINGHVEHDVVAVMGSLWLGPKARIEHDVVCLGDLHLDPDAIVHGQIVRPLGHAHFSAGPWMGSWWDRGLQHGRVLTFGPHLLWIWVASLICIGLYALVAVLVPGAVTRAGNLLVESPATTILIGLAAVLGVPLVALLLCVTIVGIPVAIFLIPMALVVPFVFGRAALYSLIGRRLFSRDLSAPAAVMAGGAVVVILLLIPVVGIMCLLILSFIAWSCGWAGLILRRSTPGASFTAPKPPIATPPPIFPAPAVAAVPVMPSFAPAEPAFSPPPPPPVFAPPPPVYGQPAAKPEAQAPSQVAAGLPRAGFWIRAGAMAIDVCLVGILCGITSDIPLFGWAFHDRSGPGPFLLLCAAYAAVLWKVRGATIGAIICHLTLVRIDGRPVDWTTAIVRALGCFISVFAIGLGFIWVAFDPERQSWHDKIAGTTVVIAPRPQSLV